MSNEGDCEIVFSRAVARYRKGRCPGCGKGIGDAKGLEYRTHSGDIYCHTCKKAWSAEIDPAELHEALRQFIPNGAELPNRNPELPSPQLPITRRRLALSGARTLIKRIVLRQ